jgi:hypothetical protein
MVLWNKTRELLVGQSLGLSGVHPGGKLQFSRCWADALHKLQVETLRDSIDGSKIEDFEAFD